MKQTVGMLSRGRLFSKCCTAVFMCITMSICLFSVRSYASPSALSGYKATATLGDADRSDAYQKNYQESKGGSEGCDSFKAAEWTDKQKGEAKISLSVNGKDLKEKETRSAVYAFNVCEGHGFRREIAEKNIKFLLKNFGRVDIVRTGVREDEAIHIKENIRSFEDVQWPVLAAGQDRITGSHRGIGLYDGLRKYLKDHKDHMPTHIYVSFDMFYTADAFVKDQDKSGLRVTEDSETGVRKLVPKLPSSLPMKAPGVSTLSGVPETMDEDCFEILKKYKAEGRYFSMACDFDGQPITKDNGTYVVHGDPECTVVTKEMAQTLGRDRFFYSVNVLAALADPDVWPGRDAAKKGFWNGEAYNPVNPADSHFSGSEIFAQKVQALKGVAPSYSYDKGFEEILSQTFSLLVKDTVADVFEIIEVTTDNQNAHINTEGNTVSVSVENYDGKAPLTVTIRVKLKGKGEGVKGTWFDTNKGAAGVWVNKKPCCFIDSPKLFFGMPNVKLPKGPDGDTFLFCILFKKTPDGRIIVFPPNGTPGSCQIQVTIVQPDGKTQVIAPPTGKVNVPFINIPINAPINIPINAPINIPINAPVNIPVNVTVNIPSVTVNVPPTSTVPPVKGKGGQDEPDPKKPDPKKPDPKKPDPGEPRIPGPGWPNWPSNPGNFGPGIPGCFPPFMPVCDPWCMPMCVPPMPMCVPPMPMCVPPMVSCYSVCC